MEKTDECESNSKCSSSSNDKENTNMDEKVGVGRVEDVNKISEEGDSRSNIQIQTDITITTEREDESEESDSDSEFMMVSSSEGMEEADPENSSGVKPASVPSVSLFHSTASNICEENDVVETQSEFERERLQLQKDVNENAKDPVPVNEHQLTILTEDQPSETIMNNSSHLQQFAEENEIVSKVFHITSSSQISSRQLGGCEWDDDHNQCQPIESLTKDTSLSSVLSKAKIENMQEYRCKLPLVMYSDTESESGSENSDSETVSQSPKLESSFDGDDEDYDDFSEGTITDTDSDDGVNVNDNIVKEKRKKRRTKGDRQRRTKGEVFPEELPPLDYLTISVNEDIKLEPLGTISGIVGVLVVIESIEARPALFDDTVLFLENRQPLGLIFETMGTIDRPFYTVRFNSNDDIVNKEIKIGNKVMYAPNASNLTKFVFIAELKRRKFVDASWESDNEPPVEEFAYSDDEQEKRAVMRARRMKYRAEKMRRNEEEGKPQKKRRSAKKRNATDNNSNKNGSTSNSSGLPQGPMNRNPFGDPARTVACLPNKSLTKRNGSKTNTTTTANNNSSSSSLFSTKWKPPPPPAKFGETPSWQPQPWPTTGAPQANPFSLFPPTFHSLPPVYNTTNTNPVQGNGMATVGHTPPPHLSPFCTSPAPAQGSGMANMGQAPPPPHHSPFCTSPAQAQGSGMANMGQAPPPPPPHCSPFPVTSSGLFTNIPNNNPNPFTFVMPSRFNTSIPPPFLPVGIAQYTQPQPAQYTQSQPAQYTQSQPAQFTQSQPAQYTQSQPAQFTQSQPAQFTQSQPAQYTQSPQPPPPPPPTPPPIGPPGNSSIPFHQHLSQ